MKNKHLDYESNPFKVIFNGFSNLFRYNQNLAIAILILSALGSFNGGFGTSGNDEMLSSGSLDAGEITVILIVVSILLGLAIIVGAFYNGCVAFIAYKTSRAETTTLKETLRVVSKKFWTILWIQIIVFVKVLGGLLLFIVPGIRALLRYDMVLFPVFDENMNAKMAIKRSKTITKNHLLEVFGMVVASGIIPLVGQTMHYGGQSIMYPQLKQLAESGAEKPPVHWLNYLGFILIGVVTVLIVLIVAVIAAAT